jgi:gamma-glutamyltranspeptidase/glutathione hydrolase
MAIPMPIHRIPAITTTKPPRGRASRWLALLFASLALPALAQPAPIHSGRDRVHPVFAGNGMVATQEAVASRVGVDILRRGGNAVDAAVAVAFALAVTLPRAGNLGGGGFMLVHDAAGGSTHAIDYRETAPAASHRDMFLDDEGEVDRARARFSHASAGVPGTVAGLALALRRFGTLPLANVMAPAIELAREGIRVTPDLAQSLAARIERLSRDADTARVFFDADEEPLAAGDLLVQADLATSLQSIASSGEDAFYRGDIAHRIEEEMRREGGLITREDLASYRAVVRAPVIGQYRGYTIASMPPPSSGGVHLIQILNLLQPFPIGFLGHNSADTIHLMAEAMKLAYADRSKHLGDSDFWPVPVAGLVSPAYADALRTGIRMDLARPSHDIAPGSPPGYESSDTTHFSIMDRHGNAVSNTYTINFSYGSGLMVAGTGILLNNEMDDFSAKPGVANAYGLLGGEANRIEPRKRPLSSMTPTLVLKDGKAILATGSPGGSRIITTTAQVIMNVVDHGMNIAEAVHAPRVHHQWLPDVLRIEEGLSLDTVDLLRARGHAPLLKSTMGSANSVMRIEQGFTGVADPRRAGALAVGY